MMIEIDHLIVCVADLGSAAAKAYDRFGLGSLEGGSHDGHGTANHLIPLGSGYIELVSVVDREKASRSEFGRWVAKKSVETPFHVDGLSLRTDALDRDAAQLGLVPLAMSRTRPDGFRLQWRLAGLEEMIGPENLPFLIQWDIPMTEHPGRGSAPHRVIPTGIGSVTVSGKVGRLRGIAGTAAGLHLVEGPPGVAGATVLADGEEVSWLEK